MSEPRSRLERIAGSGTFVVTAEVVPPRSGAGARVADQARGLVGYADAANVTDNPRASAHMSSVAGAAFVAGAGVEPTIQLACRDRNRLALTADLLGAWALGARNVLCLTGDRLAIGDHPEATDVHDLGVLDLVRLAAFLRAEGRLPNGTEVEDAPAYFIGVADSPLAPGYHPARLEEKLDAGAGFVQTQIAYDVEALHAWAEVVGARGVFERATVIVGISPLRSVKIARFMDEEVSGVSVPPALIRSLEEAGEDAAAEGTRQAIEMVKALRRVPGVAGVHLMGLGHEEAVRAVIEGAGLLPRPAVTT